MPNTIDTRGPTATTNRPRGILAACMARRHPVARLRGRSPRPDEPDIRVLVQFTCVRMEFAACRTAALAFVQDIAAKRPCSVAVDSRPCGGLPRLPNERLYLLP
ncbi:hypothetical protein [Nocardia neocaledoniensis]|uniref:hypothetical protein n=1 Tax=Nocardia neocaledoniensis TaxID=236511 RepID=UPI002458F101|nr:hypothetical protein [Nocardia neocaledoniensis]